MRIGFLSAPGDPFLGYILREFIAQKLPVSAVILDSLAWSAKNQQIHEERTGSHMPALPLKEFEEAGIAFHRVKDHREPETREWIQRLKIDLLVNAGTPRILNQALLDAVPHGVLNCHPGLLPQFRGCTCVEWAVYLDEPVGNTAHFMTMGIDEGPIVLREALRFSRKDTYVDIRVQVYRQGHQLLARAARKIMEEKITPSSLPAQGEGRYFKVIEPEKMKDVFGKLAEGRYAYQQ